MYTFMEVMKVTVVMYGILYYLWHMISHDKDAHDISVLFWVHMVYMLEEGSGTPLKLAGL